MTTPEEVLEKMLDAIEPYEDGIMPDPRGWARRMLDDILAAASACGWSLRPDEPDEAMLMASYIGTTPEIYELARHETRRVYAAMIAAAPKVGE